MAFSDDVIWIAGLLEMQLPSGTVRMSDCGAVKWGAILYDGYHTDFGTIAEVGEIEEGIADELPSWSISFLPENDAKAVTIASSAFQGRRILFHLAEISAATGLVIGTPDLLFDGIFDVPVLRMAQGVRKVEFSVVGRSDRLFMLQEGNTLSSGFHKKIWPGELGFENATGIQLARAWGIKAPPRGAVSGSVFSGSSGGGFAGFGGRGNRNEIFGEVLS